MFRARALETYLLELTGETERTEKLLTAIRSYPVVTSDVLRTLQECSRQIVRLDIRSFEAKTGILRFEETEPYRYSISLCRTDGKVDLERSSIYRKLKNCH